MIRQSFEHWELIIISDGCDDDTDEIAQQYVDKHPERIRFIKNVAARGLQACANESLEAARGDYVMRLDADDYLDESACLVMAHYLDQHPDIALVYPNYVYIDEQGRFLGLEYRKKVGHDAQLLDLPAHGACTMVRKRILKTIGGYSEKYKAQDGHELWLKVLHRYQIANVRTPLFFYRQHSRSLSQDQTRLLKARGQIKRDLLKLKDAKVKPRVVAVIPAKNSYPKLPNVVLTEVSGKRLIDYTIEAALNVADIATILVTTDDEDVVEHCRKFGGAVMSKLRPSDLSHDRIRLSQVVNNAVEYLESEQDIHADIVTLLSVHSPLRAAHHVQKAIDTLLIYNTDSVLSVYEDYDVLYTHGKFGLRPLNQGMEHQIRLEREALFVDNGAIKVMWRDIISDEDIFGRKVGHVVMSPWDSWQIKSADDLWLIGQLLERKA